MHPAHQPGSLQRGLQRVVQLRLLERLPLRAGLGQRTCLGQPQALRLLGQPCLRARCLVLQLQLVQARLQRVAVALGQRAVLLARQVGLHLRHRLAECSSVPLRPQSTLAHEPRLHRRQHVALDVLLLQTPHLAHHVRAVGVHQLADPRRVDPCRRGARSAHGLLQRTLVGAGARRHHAVALRLQGVHPGDALGRSAAWNGRCGGCGGLADIRLTYIREAL